MATAAQTVKFLRSIQVGVIGDPPDGFETSEYDIAQLKKLFGINIKKVEIDNLFKRIRSIDNNRIQSTKDILAKKLQGFEELDPMALDKSIGTYEAFMDIQKELGLKGLAVRCWPEFFTDLGCAACGAISLATQNGLACSCEVDVVGLITQLILQNLSKSPAIGVDLVGFNFRKDETAVWHCGLAPFDFANPDYPLEATTHSNRGIPLLMQFPFKPGKITIARLSHADEQMKLVLSRGEMLDRQRPFTGTCGVLRFEHPAQDVFKTMMNIGMEHHISFTYGDFYKELEVIAKLLNLPTIQL